MVYLAPRGALLNGVHTIDAKMISKKRGQLRSSDYLDGYITQLSQLRYDQRKNDRITPFRIPAQENDAFQTGHMSCLWPPAIITPTAKRDTPVVPFLP